MARALQGLAVHAALHRVHGRRHVERLAARRGRALIRDRRASSTPSCRSSPSAPAAPGETAARWRYRDGGGEIGVISSVTQAFCGTCNRARISTDGKLFTCLFASEGHDLRALLRGGVDDDELAAAMAAIWGARDDRYSEVRATLTPELRAATPEASRCRTSAADAARSRLRGRPTPRRRRGSAAASRSAPRCLIEVDEALARVERLGTVRGGCRGAERDIADASSPDAMGRRDGEPRFVGDAPHAARRGTARPRDGPGSRGRAPRDRRRGRARCRGTSTTAPLESASTAARTAPSSMGSSVMTASRDASWTLSIRSTARSAGARSVSGARARRRPRRTRRCRRPGTRRRRGPARRSSRAARRERRSRSQ